MIKHSKGFTILEVLIATLILCGVIYTFIAFTQNQDKRINQENIGKYLAILTNDIIEQTLPGGTCTPKSSGKNYSLAECLDISESFKSILSNNGLNPNTADLQVALDSDNNVILLVIQFHDGNYDQAQASIYAQQLFSNLSSGSINRLSMSENSLFAYQITDEDENVLSKGPNLFFGMAITSK